MLVVELMPVGEAVGGKRAGVVDHEVGLAEARQFLLRRADEHGVHEQRVIRPRADDADLDAILRIPAGEAVEAIEPLARVEIVERALAVDLRTCARRSGMLTGPHQMSFSEAGCLTTRLSFGERPVLAPE